METLLVPARKAGNPFRLRYFHQMPAAAYNKETAQEVEILRHFFQVR